MPVQIKRVYDKPLKEDGFRVLVDRLWPRGLSREKAKVDLWVKEIAPSDALRKWFAHDPAKWDEFRSRYFSELGKKKELFSMIAGPPGQPVTLLYGAKEEKFNNAVALREYLKKKRVLQT
jgi:uncharacterized protein YeaO (DUF488 family)